jgi:type II secretory pathway pseudopilin PulG
MMNKQRGDTIIEVMFALLIISFSLVLAFGSVNKGLRNSQSVSEKYQSVKESRTQLERLKAFSAGKRSTDEPFTISEGKPFCIGPDNNRVDVPEDVGDISAYPDQCRQGRYVVFLIREGSDFRAFTIWPGIANQTKTDKITVRIKNADGTFSTRTITLPAGVDSTEVINRLTGIDVVYVPPPTRTPVPPTPTPRVRFPGNPLDGDGYIPYVKGENMYQIFHHDKSAKLICRYVKQPMRYGCENFPYGANGYVSLTTDSGDTIASSAQSKLVIVGNRLYFSGTLTSGADYGKSGIGCYNLTTNTACPFTKVSEVVHTTCDRCTSDSSFFLARVNGILASGTKIFTFGVEESNNRVAIYCKDLVSNLDFPTDCTGYPRYISNTMKIVGPFTLFMGDQRIINNKVYAYMTDGDQKGVLSCMSVVDGSACSGWLGTGVALGALSGHSNMQFYPDLEKICSIPYNLAGAGYAATCYSMANGAVTAVPDNYQKSIASIYPGGFATTWESTEYDNGTSAVRHYTMSGDGNTGESYVYCLEVNKLTKSSLPCPGFGNVTGLPGWMKIDWYAGISTEKLFGYGVTISDGCMYGMGDGKATWGNELNGTYNYAAKTTEIDGCSTALTP